ncbi:hypothetical protein AB0L40_02470 [Patulibacter sp. NPDC049589]|uniref:hypothetical protein n=1 Tax=Patulibacter sp. NPDC049589 TaxID=3154731 RepID=UPI00342B9BB0
MRRAVPAVRRGTGPDVGPRLPLGGATLLSVLIASALVAAGCGTEPTPHATATCGTHQTQRDAQRAKDTVDADGDGVYCESLPCPCDGTPDDGRRSRSRSAAAAPTSGSSTTAGPDGGRSDATPPLGDGAGGVDEDPAGCTVVPRTVDIGISGTRYPEVRRHWERAIREGQPRVLTVRRAGAAVRRTELLRGIPTRPGEDRDEYPPAMARDRVSASVAYVDAAQNRGAGTVQGVKLRRYCSGQRFRVVWY